MLLSRQITLLGAIALTLGCANNTSPVSETSLGLFETVWADFDANYAFFPLLDINWRSLHTVYRDSVEHSRSLRETARLIGGMIGQLRDGHASLTTPEGSFGGAPYPWQDHFDANLVTRSYLASPMRRTPSGRLAYARLTDGTGYVQIPTFDGSGWGDEIDDALGELAPLSALIIDVRNNEGGSETVGQAVAARFYDTERTYRLARFRSGPAYTDLGPPVPFNLKPYGLHSFKGPIALITNRRNASASEDFVLMIVALPHAVSVGDTTRGVGSNPLQRTLPNGWTYRIPRSQQSTPDGFVYNWKGLPPRIAVTWDLDRVALGKDPYIDAALADLGRRKAAGLR